MRCVTDATFENCQFGGNQAWDRGGGFDAFYDTNNPKMHNILMVGLKYCSFTDNRAYTTNLVSASPDGWGGGVYFQDVNGVFTSCDFVNNLAKNGGALFAVGGNVTMANVLVQGNRAVGASGVNTAAVFDPNAPFGIIKTVDTSAGTDGGGGLFLVNSPATIVGCTFSDNVSQGAKGLGGAIDFYGGFVTHKVSNCLFTGNSASQYGGAIGCLAYATPTVANCTFVKDTAGTLGGAVFCDWSSAITLVNSIFTQCSNRSIGTVDFDNKTSVTYCLFYNNPQGDYGREDSVSGKISQVTGTARSATNQVADPLFVTGPLGGFYLSQTAAGQGANSPAVDKGKGVPADYGLQGYTTRTDGAPDTGTVDIGYHHPDPATVPQYTLTAHVDGNHGQVQPATGKYYAGTLVPVTAAPDKGYRVAAWTGTDDDASHSVKNLVVPWSNRAVTVTFDQPKTIVVTSNGDYTSIQRGIDAAAEGDIVLVPTGTYSPQWTGFAKPTLTINKGITLTSENPDDPNCTAATILYYVFVQVQTTGDAPATIQGFTIQHGMMPITNCSPIVRNCVFTQCQWVGSSGANGGGGAAAGATAAVGTDGYPGSPVYGGAMPITNGSPTIEKCLFSNCSATGGNGGVGSAGGGTHPDGYDGGWAGGAYGGAVYCGLASNPTFTDCQFENCFAQGGSGGNGGDAGGGGGAAGTTTTTTPAHGGRGGNWMGSPSEETGPGSIPNWAWWDGWQWGPYDPVTGQPYAGVNPPYKGVYQEYWKYSGYGGAVYCEFDSSPKFVHCTFTNNYAKGGVSGLGGGPERHQWRSRADAGPADQHRELRRGVLRGLRQQSRTGELHDHPLPSRPAARGEHSPHDSAHRARWGAGCQRRGPTTSTSATAARWPSKTTARRN